MAEKKSMKGLKLAGSLFALIAVAGIVQTSLTRRWASAPGIRGPASVPRSFDVLGQQNPQNADEARRQLILGLQAMERKGYVGLQAGHFQVQSNGQNTSVCELFPQITFRFVGEGIASHGNAPSMTVQGPCKVGDNTNRILPLWLPVDELKGHSAQNMDLNFMEPVPISVRFENLTDWPPQWILAEIALFDPKDGKNFRVDSVQIYKLTVGPRLTLTW